MRLTYDASRANDPVTWIILFGLLFASAAWLTSPYLTCLAFAVALWWAQDRCLRAPSTRGVVAWVVIGVSLHAVSVAVAIEWLNGQTRGRLPNPELLEDGSPTTWRLDTFEPDSPNNQLLRLVSELGLLQYLLVPLGLGLLCVPGARREGIVCGPLLLISGVLAWVRAYVWSLGW